MQRRTSLLTLLHLLMVSHMCACIEIDDMHEYVSHVLTHMHMQCSSQVCFVGTKLVCVCVRVCVSVSVCVSVCVCVCVCVSISIHVFLTTTRVMCSEPFKPDSSD